MKAEDTIKKMTGVLHLIAYDKDNRVIWEDKGCNLIVNSGYQAVLQSIAGMPDCHISKIGAGTNGTPQQETDTQLTNPYMIDIAYIDYPRPGTVRFNFSLGYNEGNGMAVSEFGLVTADGRLFARKTRSAPIEKTNNMSISGHWEINI